MLGITLASLRAHTGRLTTTGLAIVLGVMFVTGTLVFTGTLNANIDSQLKGSAEDFSAIAQAEEARDGETTEIPPEVLGEVAALPEVADAGGVVQGEAPLLDGDGRAVGAVPTAGMSVGEDTRYSASEGELPAGPDEVALATATADLTGFGVGDDVQILDSDGEKQTFTVTGLIDVGAEMSLANRGAVAFSEETAHAMTAVDGYSEIDVSGASGHSEDEVSDAVAEVAPDGAEVSTGTAFGERLAASSGADTQLIGTALMLAGLVSVVVAGIVISNTFAILLAQRQREMALLRCVGARRAQVLRSVLLEASIVGLVSSAIGVLAGIGVGYAGFVLGADSLDVAVSTPLVVGPGAIIGGLAVGLATTLLAALIPAVRTTRVPPLAALRSSAMERGARGSGWLRVVTAVVLAGASAAITTMAVTQLENEQALTVVVLAGLVAFGAVVAAGPLLVRAVVAVAGVPMRKLGVVSGLAADNSQRAPKRAATATIALTVGATLITGYSVISASMEATMTAQLDERFPVDYQVSAQIDPEDPAGGGVAPAVADTLANGSGVAKVISEYNSDFEAEGPQVSAHDGADLGTDITSPVAEGDLADAGPGRVVVHEDEAEGKAVGDDITVATDQGEETFEVAAITEGKDGLMGITMDPQDFHSAFPDAEPTTVGVKGGDNVSSDELRGTVLDSVADDPTLQVSSAAQLREELTSILDTAFLAITALLGLAVLIAVAGIANTMTLSVLERARESAMLRALGLTGGQLRRMLGLEAIGLCLIGAALGIGLGTVFGWAAGSSFLDRLILDIPAVEIGSFLGIAILAGLLASVLPGRRAARTSITQALASE